MYSQSAEDLVSAAFQTDIGTNPARKTVSDFATKFSIKELIRMYDNPHNIPKMFQKIVQAKLVRGYVVPDENRVQLYKIIGLANYHKHHNKGYYRKILEMTPYPVYFESTIEKDVVRTTPSVDVGEVGKEKFHERLRNVLTALCRRNPQIGYCQGFNYIVAFFLELGMDEEDAFWVTSHLIEGVIPPDYYNSMIGVLCDDRLLDLILAQRLPSLKAKIVDMGVTTSVFSVQWLVCLFTFFGINKKIVSVIMDSLLAFGPDTLLKACTAHLELAEQELNSTQELGPFLMTLEKRLRTYGNQTEFQEKMIAVRFDRKLMSEARDQIRQKILADKLMSDVKFLPKKLQQTTSLLTVRCNPNYPICLFVKEKAKIEKEYFDHLVFRTTHFVVYDDYMVNLDRHTSEDQFVIGRDHHQCPQMELGSIEYGPHEAHEEWHVSINDMKYAQYLNINDHIDYARQSYAVFKETPEVRLNPKQQQQQPVRSTSNTKNRSPFKELLLLPLKFLEANKHQEAQQKVLPTIKEKTSVSPRLVSRKKNVWKPSQTTTRMKYKGSRLQSPGFNNSTQSQTITSEFQVQQFQPKKVHSLQFQPHDETSNLKKLSIIIGQDENQLMHSSSVRFLADILIGNDQLQNIFTRPHSPNSKQISRQGSSRIIIA